MSYLSLALLALKILYALISKGVEAKAFSEGEKEQLTKSLLNTTKLVSDAKQIGDWVSEQSPEFIDSILQQYYTRKD